MADQTIPASQGQHERVTFLNQTVATQGTPEQLATENVWAAWVQLSPSKGNSGAKAYVCNSAGDATIELPVKIEASEGKHINLKSLFVDVDTDGDSVSVMYSATGR